MKEATMDRLPAYIMGPYLPGIKPNILTYQRIKCNEWEEQLTVLDCSISFKVFLKMLFLTEEKKTGCKLGGKPERYLNFLVFQ